MQCFVDCCWQIYDQLVFCMVCGIIVMIFGVDGVLVDEQGVLLYLIISWKCLCIVVVMEKISQYMFVCQLQWIVGVGVFVFNILYKLVWLKENYLQLLVQVYVWLFILLLINYWLIGEFIIDFIMVGISQMFDFWQCDFSVLILQVIGLLCCLFLWLVEVGQLIGVLLLEVVVLLGFFVGILVILVGYDIQFVLFGVGVGQDELVFFFGIWEILMVCSVQVDILLFCDYSGFICELDSQLGCYNLGMQWLVFGVFEWVCKLLWSVDILWQMLIDEVQVILFGVQGVRMQCDLFVSQYVGWQGVMFNIICGYFYCVVLEGLSDQLVQYL